MADDDSNVADAAAQFARTRVRTAAPQQQEWVKFDPETRTTRDLTKAEMTRFTEAVERPARVLPGMWDRDTFRDIRITDQVTKQQAELRAKMVPIATDVQRGQVIEAATASGVPLDPRSLERLPASKVGPMIAAYQEAMPAGWTPTQFSGQGRHTANTPAYAQFEGSAQAAKEYPPGRHQQGPAHASSDVAVAAKPSIGLTSATAVGPITSQAGADAFLAGLEKRHATGVTASMVTVTPTTPVKSVTPSSTPSHAAAPPKPMRGIRR